MKQALWQMFKPLIFQPPTAVPPVPRCPGAPVQICIQGDNLNHLSKAADEVMVKLRSIDGVSQVFSDNSPGKNEFKFYLKPEAAYLGVSLSDAASLGINVSFDLFTGGTTGSNIRQALSAQRELEDNRNKTTITAMADIRTSMEKISTARLQLALQKENTRLIKTTRNLVKLEYQSSQTSLVRLNEAQNELVSAMGNLAIAQISLTLAREEFDYYTGQNL